MKRLSLVLMSVALMLGMAQCKKNVEPVATGTTSGTMSITLDVDGGSKVSVTPSTGVVSFQTGDKIYVASNGSYVGTLEHNGTNFTGTIDGATSGSPLYFYFVGNKTPSATPTTSMRISIFDQTEELPVISAAPSNENFSESTYTYTATLLNKCALVKFDVTTSSSAPIIITGVNDVVTVTFSSSGVGTFVSSQSKGAIKMAKDGNDEYWAILAGDQGDVDADGVAYSADLMYNGTCGAISGISNNGYLDSGITVTVSTAMPYFTVNSSGKKVRFAPGNLYTENGTYYLQENQYGYVASTATSGTKFDKYAQSIVLGGGAFSGSETTVSGYTGNWYALARDEWKYLLNVNNSSASDVGQRSDVVGTILSDKDAYFMKCKVNSVQGVVIFPDGFAWDVTKMGTTPASLNGYTGNYTANSNYSLLNWTAMEAAGCVFLPAAGGSGGNVGSSGGYWSSTGGGYRLVFNASSMNVSSNAYSFCVRLAAVVE